MKTNGNGNLITIEHPEQYARIYTRTVDVGVDVAHAGREWDAPLSEDGKLLVVATGERVVRAARTAWEGGSQVQVPAETVATLTMVFGVLRDDELGKLREKANEATERLASLHHFVEQQGQQLKAAETATTKAEEARTTETKARLDETARANRAESRLRDLESDLAKVRKFFGDKGYQEAISK